MKSIAVVSMFTLVCLTPSSSDAREIERSHGFKAIFVIGDSISDTGNLWFLTNGDQPRRHSNGKLYIDYLSGYYRLGEMLPSLLGGTNYAVSGAGVGPGWDFDWPGTSAMEQFETYLGLAGGRGDEKAFYIVQIGANEFVNQILNFGWNGAASGEETANDLETLLHRVASTPGVEHLAVMTTPDITTAPVAAFLEQFVPGFTANCATASSIYNARLVEIVRSLREECRNEEGEHRGDHSCVKDVRVIDFFGLLAKIMAHPEAYGITDTTTACSGFLAPGGVTCSNPNEHVFWDHSHPSERIHQLLFELFVK